MDFKEKRILITGAAGFIGSNLTDNLLEKGAVVIGIDNLFNGRLENLSEAFKSSNFEFHKGDVRDLNFLLNIFKDIDIVYHFAAFSSVPRSIEMPAECNDVNVNGILNVLNTARKIKVDKIIFSSSSSVYGDISTLPAKEEMPRVPISPYGASKLACEAYMRAYHHVYGLKTISLRYFNVFGPRQKDSPYSGVIAIWLGNILRNEDLMINGDGTISRDYTYIKDVIQANLLAAKYDTGGEVFNIGAGAPISLTDLANLMLRLTNKNNLKICYLDPRPGDIIHLYADITAAKQKLNFNPRYNQEQGLVDYFRWYNRTYKTNLKISM
jgi:nucleoside-diphosphate-sugar epimerase